MFVTAYTVIVNVYRYHYGNTYAQQLMRFKLPNVLYIKLCLNFLENFKTPFLMFTKYF